MPDPCAVNSRITAIMERVPDWWRDDQACAEASALWGGGHNECGVFVHGQREVVGKCGDAEASVTVAESPNGLFAFGVRLGSYGHAFSYLPSIWSEAFGTRAEATQAGLCELLEALDHAHPSGKRAAEELRRLRQQIERRLSPRQGDLFTDVLTDGQQGAILPPLNNREVKMEDGQPAIEQPAPQEAAEADTVKKPRKPRAPRKRKGKEEGPVADAAGQAAGPAADAAPAELAAPAAVIEQPRAEHGEPARPTVAPPDLEQAPAPVVAPSVVEGNGHAELPVAKQRKSGRRAWDINLGGNGHTWERVTTPGGEAIVFRFKDQPDEKQMGLIAKYGFTYDENAREAYRANGPEANAAANKLGWHLRELQRGQGAALSA